MLWNNVLDLTGTIVDWLLSITTVNLDTMMNSIAGITTDSVLIGPFNTLLGSPLIFNFISNVQEHAVIPVAGTILGALILMQGVKIARLWDSGDGDLATVLGKGLWLVLAFVIFTVLINRSMEMMVAFFEISQWMARTVLGLDTGTLGEMPVILFAEDLEIGHAMSILIFSLIATTIGQVAAWCAIGIGYFRVMQIYLGFAFAPIGIAFMALDQTRQWGLGMIKVFISWCLAVVLTVVILMLFPIVGLSAGLGANAGTITIGAAEIVNPVGSLGGLGLLMILTVVLIALMFGAGRISRDFVGG